MKLFSIAIAFFLASLPNIVEGRIQTTEQRLKQQQQGNVDKVLVSTAEVPPLPVSLMKGNPHESNEGQKTRELSSAATSSTRTQAVNFSDQYGAEYLDAVQTLVQKGWSMERIENAPTKRYAHGNASELSVACGVYSSAVDFAVAKALITLGCDVNYEANGGIPPLFGAASYNDKEICDLLLNNGADPAHKTGDGRTAMDEARNQGHNELAEYLDAVQTLVQKGWSMERIENAPTKRYAHGNASELSVACGVYSSAVDFAVAKALITLGCDVNYEANGGIPPLFGAASYNDKEFCDLLLNNGADPAHKIGDGRTAMDEARNQGHNELAEYLDAVQTLVQKGWSMERIENAPTKRYAHGNASELSVACGVYSSAVDFAVAKALITLGCDVNYEANGGIPPLFGAASYNDKEFCDLLLNNGADPAHKIGDGRTAMDEARNQGHNELAEYLDAVQTLVQKGWSMERIENAPTKRYAHGNASELSVACGVYSSAVDFAVAKALITLGCDVNYEANGGIPPLFGAASYNDKEICDLLLNNGADPAHKIGDGRTAMDEARNQGHNELAEYLDAVQTLVQKGWSMERIENAPTKRYAHGNASELSVACGVYSSAVDFAVAKALITLGCDVNYEANGGIPPLFGAASYNDKEFCDLLLNNGADPAHKIGDGRTAMDEARNQGHNELAEYLDAVQTLVQKGWSMERIENAPTKRYAHGNASELSVACGVYSSAVDFAVAKALITLGCDVNYEANGGIPPLFGAASYNDKEFCDLLLNNGADPAHKIGDGRTAMDEARNQGHNELAEYLDAVQTLVQKGWSMERIENAPTKRYAHGNASELSVACGVYSSAVDFAVAKALITLGCDVNYEANGGIPPLFGAASYNDKEFCDLLLNNGADPAHKIGDGRTAMDEARNQGHNELAEYLDAVQTLVQKGWSMERIENAPTKRYAHGNASELSVACGVYSSAVDFAVAKALITLGCDVNYEANGGIPPLFGAASYNDKEFCDLLLNNGADPAHKIGDGRTAMDEARNQGHNELAEYLDAVQTLVQKGWSMERIENAPTKRYAHGNASELSVACGVYSSAVDFAVAKALITLGCDVNYEANGGIPPLFGAASYNDKEICDLLLNNGADPAHKIGDGRTAMDEARNQGHNELAEYLDAV